MKAIGVVTVQGFCSLTSALGLATLAGVSFVLEPEQFRHAVHLPAWWTRVVGTGVIGGMLAATFIAI